MAKYVHRPITGLDLEVAMILTEPAVNQGHDFYPLLSKEKSSWFSFFTGCPVTFHTYFHLLFLPDSNAGKLVGQKPPLKPKDT